MVRQPGEVLLRKPRLEERVLARHSVADHRAVGVLALSDEELVVGEGVDQRMLVPGMTGKEMGDGPRPRILGLEVESDAGPEQRGESLLKTAPVVRIPMETRNVGRRRRGPLETLGHRGLKRAVRGDFQKHVRTEFAHDRVDRAGEVRGCADIRPPVGTIEAFRAVAGHGGDEGDAGVERAVVQEREGLARVVPDGIHGGGMERDIPREQMVLHVAAVKFRHDRPQLRLPAAGDHAGRRVLAGDLHLRRPVPAGPERDVKRVEHVLHAGEIETDRQHPPGTGPALLQRRAAMDEPRRVGERQRPGGVGGRDLPRTVPDDAFQMHAPGLEEFEEGALDYEDRGLGEPDLVEFLLGGVESGVAQRNVRVCPPVVFDGVDRPAEDRVGIVESATATRPLGPLAREDHRDSAFAVVGRADVRGTLGELVQRREQLLPVSHREGRSGGEVRATAAQIARHRVEHGDDDAARAARAR